MKTENLEKILELRHHLHRYPCLSGREGETKETLMHFLRLHSSLELVDRGKWFYAAYHPEKSRGSIAFRADMDALKINETTDLPYRSVHAGVSHKCGHDGHSAALAGFALETEAAGADRDVYFIFQHAEETGEGGEECARLLEEEQIGEVYALHNLPGIPFGAIGIREGTICCASKGMEIRLKGRSAHASQPENGINPACAISRIVLALREIADPARYTGLILATVVQIDVGERAFGVAAHEGVLRLTIRGQHEEEMLRMQKEIEAFVEKAAAEDGLSVAFSFTEEFPETFDHPESIAKLRRIAAENGWPVYEMPDPIRSSEDFGYYTRKTPGALIWMGAGEDRPPLHSENFDFNDALLERFIALFTALLHSR